MMSKKEYREFEDHVLSQFLIGSEIEYMGNEYTVLTSGKPIPQRNSGECKTDVYVRLVDPREVNKDIELKISCKLLSSNEFQENKLSEQRALDYFGTDAKQIIESATRNLSDVFESGLLNSPSGYKSTKGGYLTLGWLVDITTKKRRKSQPFEMTDQKIRDLVYIGKGLSENKKNAVVNGQIVPESGLANLMLVSDISRITSYKDVLEQMIPIESYEIKDHFVILKAINFFPGAFNYNNASAYDGNRPFAVRVNWEYDAEIDELISEVDYNNPFDESGNADAMYAKAKDAFLQLSREKQEQYILKPKYIQKYSLTPKDCL